jgi:hypothetical protein
MMTETETHTCPKIFHVWEERLVEWDTMPRGMIRQFVNHIVALGMYDVRQGQRSNLDAGHAADLLSIFTREVATADKYRLEPEHNAYGLSWLKSNHAAVMDSINPPDDYMDLDQIVETDPFRWDGWTTGSSTWYRVESSPEYAVRYYRPNGEVSTWRYSWGPWQRGAY